MKQKYQQRDIEAHKSERAIECEKFNVLFFQFKFLSHNFFFCLNFLLFIKKMKKKWTEQISTHLDFKAHSYRNFLMWAFTLSLSFLYLNDFILLMWCEVMFAYLDWKNFYAYLSVFFTVRMRSNWIILIFFSPRKIIECAKWIILNQNKKRNNLSEQH